MTHNDTLPSVPEKRPRGRPRKDKEAKEAKEGTHPSDPSPRRLRKRGPAVPPDSPPPPNPVFPLNSLEPSDHEMITPAQHRSKSPTPSPRISVSPVAENTPPALPLDSLEPSDQETTTPSQCCPSTPDWYQPEGLQTPTESSHPLSSPTLSPRISVSPVAENTPEWSAGTPPLTCQSSLADGDNGPSPRDFLSAQATLSDRAEALLSLFFDRSYTEGSRVVVGLPQTPEPKKSGPEPKKSGPKPKKSGPKPNKQGKASSKEPQAVSEPEQEPQAMSEPKQEPQAVLKPEQELPARDAEPLHPGDQIGRLLGAISVSLVRYGFYQREEVTLVFKRQSNKPLGVGA